METSLDQTIAVENKTIDSANSSIINYNQIRALNYSGVFNKDEFMNNTNNSIIEEIDSEKEQTPT